MFDSQRFEFLENTLSTVAIAGPSEPDDLHYAFPIAYWDAKASGREHEQYFPKQFAHHCA
jgi:hypothetical protein